MVSLQGAEVVLPAELVDDLGLKVGGETYRFDRRWKETELFHFVLRRALGGEPLPYARLTAEVIG